MSSSNKRLRRAPSPIPFPDSSSDDEGEQGSNKYEVRKICSKRVTTDEEGKETTEYLIDWEPTWMNADEIGQHESVQEFEAKKGKGKKKQAPAAATVSFSLQPDDDEDDENEYSNELDEFRTMLRVGVEAKDLQKTVYGRKLYDRVLGCMYFGNSSTEKAKEALAKCFSASNNLVGVRDPFTGVQICGACGMTRTMSHWIQGFGNVGSDCAQRLIAARELFSFLHSVALPINQGDLKVSKELEQALLVAHAHSSK
jgi:hypothetical protein